MRSLGKMAVDVAATFKVDIRNIACVSLPAFSAGRVPSVFVKLNFDNFKVSDGGRKQPVSST